MSFLFESTLVLHQRKHSGEKPFLCNHCTKKFVQTAHLGVHQRTHPLDNVFQGIHYGKNFSKINSSENIYWGEAITV